MSVFAFQIKIGKRERRKVTAVSENGNVLLLMGRIDFFLHLIES